MDWRSIRELGHELISAFLLWLYPGNLGPTKKEEA